MRGSARYGLLFILLHWLLALAALTLLGLGWALHARPTTTDLNVQLGALHVSLGLSLGVLVALMLLIRLFGAPRSPEAIAPWRRFLGGTIHALIYLALLALVASGYLRLALSGTPVEFWGTPLPVWLEGDEGLAQQMTLAHQIAGFALAGLIALHIVLTLANGFKAPGFAWRMLPVGGRDAAPAPLLTTADVGGKLAGRLGRWLTTLGWAQFWLQFVIAFICALLLQFATSGRLFSSLSLGFGDAMYWGGASLVLLCIGCAEGFDYTRLARKIGLFPGRYLGAEKRAGFGASTPAFAFRCSASSWLSSASRSAFSCLSRKPCRSRQALR